MWLEPMPNGGIITRVLPGDDSQVLQARVPSPVPTPFGRGLRRTAPRAARSGRGRGRQAAEMCAITRCFEWSMARIGVLGASE